MTLREKKVAEGQRDILILIAGLFVRQLMFRPMLGDLPAKAPLLAASMMPGPPPLTTEKPASDSDARDLLGELIIGVIGLGAGRAEDADRGLDARQALEAFDEFRHDLEDLPGLAGEHGIIDGVHARMRIYCYRTCC